MPEPAQPLPDPSENSDAITERKRGGSANLKPFPKGVSGNPGGRPKGLAAKTREILGNDDGETLVRFWSAVLSGAVPASRLVPDKSEGAARGSMRLESYTEIVEVRERVAVSKLLAERGWGKPPAYAPIEEQDPLGLSEEETAALARSLDDRLDELSARRAKNVAEIAAAAARVEAATKNGA